jgi:hypothetical protein
MLVFLTHLDVEATNKESEPALSPLGDLPQSDEQVLLGMRRQGLRRPPLVAIGRLAGRTALTVIATVPEPQRTAVAGG